MADLAYITKLYGLTEDQLLSVIANCAGRGRGTLEMQSDRVTFRCRSCGCRTYLNKTSKNKDRALKGLCMCCAEGKTRPKKVKGENPKMVEYECDDCGELYRGGPWERKYSVRLCSGCKRTRD